MRYAFSYPTQSICCAQHLAEIRRRRSTYERKVYRSPSPSQLSRSAVSLADMSNTRDEREALKQTKKRKREKRTKRKSLWDITSLSKDQLFLCCLRALLLPPSGPSQQKKKRKATNRDKEMEKTRTIRCY